MKLNKIIYQYVCSLHPSLRTTHFIALKLNKNYYYVNALLNDLVRKNLLKRVKSGQKTIFLPKITNNNNKIPECSVVTRLI